MYFSSLLVCAVVVYYVLDYFDRNFISCLPNNKQNRFKTRIPQQILTVHLRICVRVHKQQKFYSFLIRKQQIKVK